MSFLVPSFFGYQQAPMWIHRRDPGVRALRSADAPVPGFYGYEKKTAGSGVRKVKNKPAEPLRRFRGLNLRKGARGVRAKDFDKGTKERGRFRFHVYRAEDPSTPGRNPEWKPIVVATRPLTVDAENSNAAAKKVVSRLKRAGIVGVGDDEMYDFYITRTVELNPERVPAGKIPRRTMFYHYEGRFVAKPEKVERGEDESETSYEVEGVAEVSAFDGEHFSVPSVNMKRVKKLVNSVLSTQVSIRSLQRQSMLDDKPKRLRNAFIDAKVKSKSRSKSKSKSS